MKSSQQSFQPAYCTVPSASTVAAASLKGTGRPLPRLSPRPPAPRPSMATMDASTKMARHTIKTTLERLPFLPFSSARSRKKVVTTSIKDTADVRAAMRTSR